MRQFNEKKDAQRTTQGVIHGEPPAVEGITDYDEAHMAIYFQLLHGSASGYSISRLALEAFGIDASSQPDRANSIVESHLRRAKWLSSEGRHHLLADTLVKSGTI